jgi:hypothetical protein
VILTKYYSDDQSKKNKIAGYVARTGKRRDAYKVWLKNLGARDHFKDPGIDERINYNGTSESAIGHGMDKSGSR